MGKTWHSVNDLYFAKTPDKGKAKAQEADDEPKKKNDDPEVRLSDGKFVAGVEGFQFNKKCKVKVKVDLLKKTNRKKVTFKLFVVYNNKEEDLAHQAEGYEENGFAEAEVTLFYGDAYSKALQKDPAAKCQYKFKASHSKGEKEIESELLEMPAESKKKVNEIKLCIEYPDKTPHKQYVNLKSNDKEQGADLKIKVKTENAKDKQIIYWKVTADTKNSKRNKPEPGLKNPADNKFVKIDKGAAQLETEVKSEKSEVILCCGLAGGDKFTVEAGIKKDEWLKKVEIENWRKIWYQFTNEKGLNLPDPDNSRKAFEEVGIELIVCAQKEFEKSDPNIPDRTFYKEYMIECNGSDKEVAVVGSHNKTAFRKYFVKEADKPTKCHLIICQHQWDEGTSLPVKKVKIFSNPSASIVFEKTIFNPYLKGKLIVDGKWNSLADAKHPDFGKKGVLTDANILIEKKRTTNKEIKISLPTGAPVPSKKSPVEITLKLNGVDGPFLGESGSPHMLCVYDPTDKTDFKNTVSHEIAHAFNQVPDDGTHVAAAQAPGLSKHPRYYYSQGGHCNAVLDAGKKQIAGTAAGGDYTTGICIMYEAKDSSCINKFCDICKEYFKANDCSDFKKS